MAEALEEIFSHDEFEESVSENSAQQYCSDCTVDKYFGCSMNNKRAQESEDTVSIKICIIKIYIVDVSHINSELKYLFFSLHF